MRDVGTNPELVPMVLHGVRTRDARGGEEAIRRALEVDEQGRLKIWLRGDRGRKKLASASLDTSATTVFTALGDYKDCLIVAANVDSTARTFQLNHVISGGAAADSNSICKAVPIGVGQFMATHEGIGFSKGETLVGLCSSANTVTITLYGVAT